MRQAAPSTPAPARLPGTLLALALVTLAALAEQAARAGPLDPPTNSAAPGAFRPGLTAPRPDLGAEERERFARGRALFRQSWIVAPAANTRADGLGPLYNRLACVACHPDNGRGRAPDFAHERLRGMLVRIALPGGVPHPVYGDQLQEEGVPGVPGEARTGIAWLTRVETLPDGDRVELRWPRVIVADPAYGPLGDAWLSPRIGPALVGLGWLEAVPDAELQRLARARKPDGVRGRPGRTPDGAIGRFGFKADAADLDAQNAVAFSRDLGITSPALPHATCTAAQTACRTAPDGGQPEIDADALADVAFYLAHLALPPPRPPNATIRRGARLFRTTGCAVCHRPVLPVASHPRYPRLSAGVIAPYTDLLLHDLGEGLADPAGLPDRRFWRTAPLWGFAAVRVQDPHATLLHDGRARNVEEAILWHGGEAAVATARYRQLDRSSRAALRVFVESR